MLENGTLIIEKSVAEDEGQYLCQAQNGVGEGISKLAEVIINGKIRYSRYATIHLQSKFYRDLNKKL